MFLFPITKCKYKVSAKENILFTNMFHQTFLFPRWTKLNKEKSQADLDKTSLLSLPTLSSNGSCYNYKLQIVEIFLHFMYQNLN